MENEGVHDIQSAIKVNPMESLLKNLKGIQGKLQEKFILKKPVVKPIKTYGLGAYLPPKTTETKFVSEKVFLPKKSENMVLATTGTGRQEGLCNNVFFETLLEIIIFFFILKWLFGFSIY